MTIQEDKALDLHLVDLYVDELRRFNSIVSLKPKYKESIVYGECAKHQGQNMANCIYCKGESVFKFVNL